MSVTSSVTFGMLENSCRTPSIRTDEMAAPGIDDKRVRRRAFPSVYPKPGCNGSMTNFERVGEMVSSWIWGRATISTCVHLLAEDQPVLLRPFAPPAGRQARRAVLLT